MSNTMRPYIASTGLLQSGLHKSPSEDIEKHAPRAIWADQLLPNEHQAKSFYENTESFTAIQSRVFVKDSRPVVIVFAILGLLPVTLKPTLRVSFHPYRSTLLWCLFSFGFLLWSVYVALNNVSSRLKIKDGGAYDFLAFSAVVGLLTVFAIPFLWIELSYGMKNSKDFCKLEKRVQWLSCKTAARSSWWLTSSVIECPVLIYAMRFLGPNWGFKLHSVVAFSLLGVLMFCLPMNITSWFSSIKTNTVHLASQFEKELRSGRLNPARVRFHRRTWLLLRAVVCRGMLMPYALLAFLQFIVVLNVLYAYNAVVQLSSGNHTTGICMSYSCMAINGMLFFICHKAHLASDAVTRSYLELLQDKKYATMYKESTLHEVELFRQLIMRKITKVSLAGFCDVSRELYCSVTTATITYVIVLFQMKLQSA